MPIYPRKNPYLIFKRTADGVEIYPFYDRDRKNAYLVTEETCRFLRSLNGQRSPYEINRNYSKAKVDRLLEEFKNNNLLFQGRCLKVGIGSILIPVVYPSQVNRHRKLTHVISLISMFSFIPCSILGLCLWHKHGYTTDQLHLISMVLGGLIGTIAHEAGHFTAANGKAHVFAAGIGFLHFMPMAFVLIDTDRIQNALLRAYIDFAGPETNLILFGLLMPISFSAAYINLLLGVSNLLPLPGLDAYSMLKDLTSREERKHVHVLE